MGNIWKPLRNINGGDLVATNGIKLYQSQEWLYEQYYIKNLLPREIAIICGANRQTIMNWLKKFNMQKLLRPPITESTREKFKKRRQENNPTWKGNLAKIDAGRARAKRWYKDKPCEKCGSNKNIVRHHIDRNTLNNNINNLMFLCNCCHRKLHNNEDGHPSSLTIKWVRVEHIKYYKQQMTYDLEIDHPAHNFVANGIVTHNSQLSQRYVNETDTAFIVPPAIQDLKAIDLEWYNIWANHCEKSRELYTQLTTRLAEMYQNIEDPLERRKKARQAARSVLPGCTETKIFVTFNGRSVRHFIELRASSAADLEIRKLAVAIYKIILKEFPLLTHGMSLETASDGTEIVVSKYRKV